MKTSRTLEFSRRHFVRTAGVGLAGLAFQPLVPRLLASTRANAATDPRVLVVIHLLGGHDGFSTLVPFQDDRYYQQRPTLSLPRRDLISLGETWALNRASQPFEALFKDGKMAVVPKAGYPNPSDSHYRASEIWHTASAADEVLYSGWLGRCFSQLQANGRPVSGFYASKSLPRVFMREEDHAALRLESADDRDFRRPLVAASAAPLDALMEIGERAGATRETEIYFVAVPGFDTHARQLETQSVRLNAISRALADLQKRLEQRGVAERTLTMTFSEFGRSLQENAQGGTDHGGGSPLFLLGKTVRGGFHLPGQVEPTDFRKVVRTIVSDWLDVPPRTVFAQDPGRIELLRAPASAREFTS